MSANRKLALSALISSFVAQASAQQLEEVVVFSKPTTYANSLVSDGMLLQQSSITSVLSVIDNLPGVLINEGDVFGSDDWSTTVSMRGFQLSLDEQQIGMTVDGIPNGNSNYGGGSKANRFIDTENLETVEVSQGTADIASRSHEALGGTLNFITQNPIEEQRSRFSVTLGDYNSKKFYFRHDTGVLWDTTRAYFSYSDSDVHSWIDESGESNRNHAALKVISEFSWADITAYASYDDTQEDNYQRVSAAQFKQNPDWDRLTSDWTGIPYVDQLYRRGWSTLRENFLSYVRFDFQFNDALSIQVTPYIHSNEGRGDWLPPYIVDVRDDGFGNAHSELNSGSTVRGGNPLGLFTYVAITGRPLSPASNCASLTFPYGGTYSNPENPALLAQDPACFDTNAVPVSSYRHTHYDKDRLGLTGDTAFEVGSGLLQNTLRGGFWWENQTRTESRDWHMVIDSRTSYHYDHTPYWVQYDREYPQETLMLYIEDTFTVGPVAMHLGAKQWFVDVERDDKFDVNGSGKVSSDSDLLPSAGVLWKATDALEFFAGYAENYASIKDAVLEAANLATNPDALDGIEAETATNTDFGLRFTNDVLALSATYYDIQFDNRITFLTPGGEGVPDYLGELDGEYRNVGGIDSKGFELSAAWNISDNLSLYSSYTSNDSSYRGFKQSDTGLTRAELITYEERLGIYRGNTVFGSADDLYVVSLDWEQDAYLAGITTKHVGKRWLDAANTSLADAYDVADVYFGIRGDALGDFQSYEINFTINNVFNEDYIGGISGGSGGWIGGARTAAINLRLDF